MSDDEVNVKVTADTSDATSNIQDASEQAKASFGELGNSAKGAGDALKNDVGNGASTANAHLKEMGEGCMNVGESLNNIKGAIGGAFEAAGIAAAAEAIKKVVEGIGEAAERAEQLKNNAMIFGASTTALQGLYAAAAQVGVQTDTVNRAMEQMTEHMQEAREGSASMQSELAAAGISIADLQNPAFGAVDALSKLASSGDSTGQIIQLLGPRAVELEAAFGDLKGGVAGLSAEAAKYGALNQQEIDRLVAYKDRITAAGLEWQNMKDTMASQLAPMVTTLMDEFSSLFSGVDSGNTIMEDFRVLMAGVATVLDVVIGGVQRAAVAFVAFGKYAGDSIALWIEEISDLGHLDFSAAKADWASYMDNMKQLGMDTFEKLKTGAETEAASISKIWAQALNPSVGNAAAEPAANGA